MHAQSSARARRGNAAPPNPNMWCTTTTPTLARLPWTHPRQAREEVIITCVYNLPTYEYFNTTSTIPSRIIVQYMVIHVAYILIRSEGYRGGRGREKRVVGTVK